MEARFKSFSSGSCGNCYFLGLFDDDGTCEAGVVIDAGVSMRRIKRELALEGLGMDDFSAILVTHDHMDHIRSLGSYCKHLAKPVYATETLHRALSRHTMCCEYIGGCRKVMGDEWVDIVPGLIKARWFEVPHDATQTVGYAVLLGDHKYVHITDCGRITAEAMGWLKQADTVVIESNYDPYMLEHGPYPRELQVRISNGHGHMANCECAAAIREFAHEGLRNIFLCHLSEHNNTPELAMQESRAALDPLGLSVKCPNGAERGIRLCPLPRQTPSQMFVL